MNEDPGKDKLSLSLMNGTHIINVCKWKKETSDIYYKFSTIIVFVEQRYNWCDGDMKKKKVVEIVVKKCNRNSMKIKKHYLSDIFNFSTN